MIKSNKSSFKRAGIVTMLAFCSLGSVYGQQSLSNVNSIYDEQHPVLHPNGDLYYSLGLHPQNVGGERDLGDIWTSPKTGESEWGRPVHLKSISTSGNDVVVGFPSDNTMLVYHDGTGRKQGIHQYTFTGNTWSYEKLVDLGSFRNNSPHFSGRLNEKGDIIIMSLESFGSYGNEDIYVSFQKANGTWSTPQNLGPSINTYKQEMTPSLSKDGLTLYFSSNGHGTVGGRNILYAQRLDQSWENWSTPVPLSEINSSGVELAYVELGDRAMYTTTQNSEGFGDFLLTSKVEITQANPIEEPVATVEETLPTIKEEIQPDRKVTEIAEEVKSEVSPKIEVEVQPEVAKEEKKVAEPKRTLINDITVLDINTLEEIPYTAAIVGESNTDDQVEELSIYSDDLEVRISSKGYFPQIFGAKALQQMTEPIYLTPIVKGTSIRLDDIYFKKGTADLADDTSPANIQKLADFLKENPDVKIRLEGHTDNIGDPQLNKELSMNRAGQIRNFLVEKGIEFERIRVSGWGGSRPVASNQTEEGRNQNRRVEMVIEE
ncbi:MAG TPA: OmpA family protein [Anditalea sp.]|nr:OmpA family protein [Anditalea sp.]